MKKRESKQMEEMCVRKEGKVEGRNRGGDSE